jgi:HD superfamily phosphodiesterase
VIHVGIARCFTYGGSKNSALHDPRILPRDNLSKEKYMSKEEKQTSINHFHEKLFKLKDMMKTEVINHLLYRSLVTAAHSSCINSGRKHCPYT